MRQPQIMVLYGMMGMVVEHTMNLNTTKMAAYLKNIGNTGNYQKVNWKK